MYLFYSMREVESGETGGVIRVSRGKQRLSCQSSVKPWFWLGYTDWEPDRKFLGKKMRG